MRRFWLTHAVLPGFAYFAILLAIESSGFDESFARAWAYGPSLGWLGSHRWWANELIHTGGRAMVWVIGLSSIGAFIASFRSMRWQPHRARALYVVLGIGLTTALVALLKSQSLTHCPWSLEDFGGSQPYVHLLDFQSVTRTAGECFPAAHSSSGFALMAFYFVFRDWRPRAAIIAGPSGFLLGALFAFGQESRGAHFLSHDLTSAILAWYVLLSLYAAMGLRTSPTGPAS